MSPLPFRQHHADKRSKNYDRHESRNHHYEARKKRTSRTEAAASCQPPYPERGMLTAAIGLPHVDE